MPLFGLDGVSPELPERCWIAPNASLIGKVTLHEEASIWFGAVLRGDNERITIGRRSNIQDLTVIHTDPGFPASIGEGCTIGHRAILHGCRIGENSLVGMGAIVLNGAIIGRNCLVGAGTLIPEGKEIPDSSLVVGTPGKVVRTLDADTIDGLRRAAAHYVANWQRFASSLRPVQLN
jgi:carbonic anhydrase/acetyltransferase-like protein (isoleucine patch superfamily)